MHVQLLTIIDHHLPMSFRSLLADVLISIFESLVMRRSRQNKITFGRVEVVAAVLGLNGIEGYGSINILFPPECSAPGVLERAAGLSEGLVSGGAAVAAAARHVLSLCAAASACVGPLLLLDWVGVLGSTSVGRAFLASTQKAIYATFK